MHFGRPSLDGLVHETNKLYGCAGMKRNLVSKKVELEEKTELESRALVDPVLKMQTTMNWRQ